VLVLGIFFFQIREQFDSLDLHHLESLKERQSLEASPLPNASESSDSTRLGEES